ncbi:hypothetical protein NUW54_g11548 [Trametes sanguinea]|uniref:Uncharacterized protein n=1 Tax=Trametes sanguinea TaxID=158606 RepID=A0ACC1NBZ4_9APHY|nr:hypothetical protein NUW54_g11548 [Trametes sanguinea]
MANIHMNRFGIALHLSAHCQAKLRNVKQWCQSAGANIADVLQERFDELAIRCAIEEDYAWATTADPCPRQSYCGPETLLLPMTLVRDQLVFKYWTSMPPDSCSVTFAAQPDPLGERSCRNSRRPLVKGMHVCIAQESLRRPSGTQ